MREGFDRLLLDPPRSGADVVLKQLPLKGLKRIVYVSCHPASLARDAGYLVNERGWKLRAAGVMDMFPHTAHVESIAMFEQPRLDRTALGALAHAHGHRNRTQVPRHQRRLAQPPRAKSCPWRRATSTTSATVDGGAMTRSVRVRIAGDEAFLNLKSRELGHTRQEFDYPIPVADARALLALCVGGRDRQAPTLRRTRRPLWEVDEFLGDNAGLVVAELELDRADEAFAKPAWLGVEVTDAPRYYNLALASRPYSQWSEAEREAST